MIKLANPAILAAGLLLGSSSESAAQTVPPNTPEEVGRLLAVLKSSGASHKEKVDACRGLAVIGTKEAVPVLAPLLADEQLSHMARYALEPIPDKSVDGVLRRALDKLHGRLLAGVVASVGVRRDAEAVPQLIRLLGNSDTAVASAAARSLGKIATPEAAAALLGRLAKAKGLVRLAVADACLACAEARLAQKQPEEAAAIYGAVGKANLPKHFRVAAMQGALRARRARQGK